MEPWGKEAQASRSSSSRSQPGQSQMVVRLSSVKGHNKVPVRMIRDQRVILLLFNLFQVNLFQVNLPTHQLIHLPTTMTLRTHQPLQTKPLTNLVRHQHPAHLSTTRRTLVTTQKSVCLQNDLPSNGHKLFRNCLRPGRTRLVRSFCWSCAPTAVAKRYRRSPCGAPVSRQPLALTVAVLQSVALWL